MKKLLFILLLLPTIAHSADKYKIITSTASNKIGYQIKGSQAYSFSSDSGTTPSVFISSYAVNVIPSIIVGATVQYSLVSGTATNSVDLTTNQTIGGTKTFSNTISGSINGNSVTVTSGVYTTGDQTIAGTKTFSGNVGIVTADALYNLNIGDSTQNNASNTIRILSGNTSGNAAKLRLLRAGNVYFDIYQSATDDYLHIDSNSGANVVVSYAGNVGIKTSSPALPLQVNGVQALPANSGTAAAGRMRLDGSDRIAMDIGAYNSAPYPAWIQVHDSGDQSINYPLSLQPNGGNVGINTTNPTSALYIVGNCSADSFTDRTPSPRTIEEALRIIKSHTTKQGKYEVDDSKLDDLVRVKKVTKTKDKNGNEVTEEKYERNLSMMISALTMMAQDYERRIAELERKIK